jgi:hypothetical protein
MRCLSVSIHVNDVTQIGDVVFLTVVLILESRAP